LDTSERRDWIA